jgi:U4/U6.U5 tri-snRNP-associated protein 1
MGEADEIVLSVEETNALRAKLGLKPLRINSGGGGSGGRDGSAGQSQSGISAEELSLSVDDTNALRARLGLAPLRTSSAAAASGRGASEAVHAPAANLGHDKAARQRAEDARAKREAEAGIGRLAARAGLGDDGGDDKADDDDGDDADGDDADGGGGAASWAAKMRSGKGRDTGDKKKASSGGGDDGQVAAKKRKKKRSKKGSAGGGADVNRISVPGDDEEGGEEGEYGAQDLRGMAVGHAADEFEAGTTTVLTLADTSLLGGDDGGATASSATGGGNVLENANMRDDGVSRDNLRKKRQVEMGMGHAGGYAGYDDDEFEEIGGSQVAGRLGSGGGGGSGAPEDNPAGKVGFRIGEAASKGRGGTADSADGKSDLFAAGSGRAVSLQTASQKSASDFMTHEEADAMDVDAVREREKREKEARKREKKLFKKMQKDQMKRDKKEHKRQMRRGAGDEGNSEDGDDIDDAGVAGPVAVKKKGGSSILDDLEATAHSSIRDGKARDRGSRRRREREGTDGDDGRAEDDAMEEDLGGADEQEALKKKRRKFEEVMEKGNKRTADAFGLSAKAKDANKKGVAEDDGEDDAFLNAALAKARRLQKLKKMQAGAGKDPSVPDADFVRSSGGTVFKGAEAVAQAVLLTKAKECNDEGAANGTNGSGGGVTFEFDETREFTRALRARKEQANRGVSGSSRVTGGLKIAQQRPDNKSKDNIDKEIIVKDTMEIEGEDIDDNMEELTQEMSDGEDGGGDGGFGSTANSAPVGRGLANVLSMLKQTGEITGKNAGKEELRGRAKDERTYEDYEALNLKEVVKIDQSALMNEKDREFANREIKLEYRDEHGRLLTRKEAYRQMCYQFHGHGSSKKNEERRLKQIARERAEAAAASRHQGGKGTLGALQATQEATGKAFVVHKTG